MLKDIEIQNFKCIKELKLNDLKPLVIFCGENNTGKSSVLQSIIFLKASIIRNTVFWRDDYASLYSFEDAVYQHNKENMIKIRLKFSLDENYKLLSKMRDPIDIEYEIIGDNLLKSAVIQGYEGFCIDGSKIFKCERNPRDDSIDETYTYTKNEIEYFPNKDRQFREFSWGGDFRLIDTINRYFQRSLSVFKKLDYFAPNPQVHKWIDYVSEDEIVGIRGENIISKLHYYQSKKDPIFDNVKGVLNSFNISMEDTISPVREKGITIEGVSRGISSNLKLFGDGVNNLITIVTVIESSSVGDILLFEEPEKHLHKSAIYNLAEYLIEASRKDRQIICCTHSFDLTNKLWKMVREGSLQEDEVSLIKFTNVEKDGEQNIQTERVSLEQRHDAWRNELKEIYG